MNQELRAGNFTSSQIAALMSNDKSGKGMGAPGKTYVEERNMERRLGRSLNTEISSKPTSWGSLMEKRVLEEILGLDYKPLSTETILHPEINYWAGSPDAIKYDEGNTVADIKSPFTLKSFCQFADCKSIDEIRENHKDGETYFWQLISNAILTNSKWCELIVYCPYRSEIAAIRELTQTLDHDEQSKYQWIYWANAEDIPFLPDGGFYKNLVTFRFEATEQDKNLLIGRVLQAGNLLVPRIEIQTLTEAA